MDKQTLSNYGWVIVVVLVLAVMLGLATPFGKYVGVGIGNIAKAYKEASNADAIDKNVDTMRDEWNSFFGNETAPKFGDGKIEYGVNDPDLNHNGVIPEGGTYTLANGTVLNAGDNFPATPQPLDAYRYGNYTYVYSADFYYEPYTFAFENQFRNGEYDGWLVTIRQETSDGSSYGYQLKKTEYGAILESINNKKITNMTNTFYECDTLTTAPAIPNSVTNMCGTFSYCENLITAPTIPNSVTDMSGTFSYCENLIAAPVIPSSITNMDGTFFGCLSLTTAPDMSNASSVTDMYETFYDCRNLTDAPVIPSSVTDMRGTFFGCENLITAPVIPSSITNMDGTFFGCENLITAPVIPSSVTNMNSTFCGCKNLTTAPTIPSSVTSMGGTFSYCENLITAPTIPSSVTNMEATFMGCINLTDAPVIPSSVTNMGCTFCGCTNLTDAPVIPSSVTEIWNTFEGCSNLTGTVTINANPTYYNSCFYDTVKPITLTGSSTKLAELAATSDNGNVTVG